MTPYYQGGGITLFHGDCRDVLPDLAIDLTSVSSVVTDPPYASTSLPWDSWPNGWVAAVSAAVPLTTSMWCFAPLRTLLTHQQEFTDQGWDLAQDIVWEKHNGSGFAADRFRRVHETITHWSRGAWAGLYKAPVTTPDAVSRRVIRRTRPAHFGEVGTGRYESVMGGPRLERSVIKIRSEHGRAEHPTQKPEGIVEPLVAYSTPVGGTVLDPFAGSGTTLLVARNTARRAVGIEADEKYCELIVRRLSQEALDFASPISQGGEA